MKRTVFYLAAVAVHLLVLFGMKAPQSQAAPVKVEQKYVEITLDDSLPADSPAPLPADTPSPAAAEGMTTGANPDAAVSPSEPTQGTPAIAGDSAPAAPNTSASPTAPASPGSPSPSAGPVSPSEPASPVSPASPVEPVSPPAMISEPPGFPGNLPGNEFGPRGNRIGGDFGNRGGGGGGGLGGGRGGIGGAGGGGGGGVPSSRPVPSPPRLPVPPPPRIVQSGGYFGGGYTSPSLPQAAPQPVGGPVVMLPADSSNPVHYFQAFSAANGIDWAEAQAFAGRLHGYLALINSAGENSFVFQLVADSIYWRNVAGPFEEDSMGPWLGGTQAANSRMTDAGWSWSNGRPFTYANWLSHTFNQSGEGESHLSFYGKGERNPQPTWSGSPKASRASGFVVEYDRDPSLQDQ